MPVKRKTKKKSLEQISTSAFQKEIEFKYDAEHITVLEFIDFAEKLTSGSGEFIRGTDSFYGKPSSPDSFMRLRVNTYSSIQEKELTFKKKLSKDNNFIRIEHNVPLNIDATYETVEAFCASLGYKYNMALMKCSDIFKTDDYVIAYYTCYEQTKTGLLLYLGAFLEVEVLANNKSTKQAFKDLCKLETKLKPLGITPKHRLKKSLWEMYRK